MKDLPIMSTKEARKLLGKEAQGMDDDQVLAVILLLTNVAKAYLEKTKEINLAKGLK